MWARASDPPYGFSRGNSRAAMPTTPNCPATSSAPVASAGVSAEAPSRKSGRPRTPPVSVPAPMNAAVAVRKSSPTSIAVLLVDALVGPPGGIGPFDSGAAEVVAPLAADPVG
jgi:hypothetical protein